MVTEQGLSIDMLQQYKEHPVYKAFITAAVLRRRQIMADFESQTTTPSLDAVRYLQGELSGVDFWLGFVDKLIEDLTKNGT